MFTKTITIIFLILFARDLSSQVKVPVEINRYFYPFETQGIIYVNVQLFENKNELLNMDFDELNDSNRLTLLDTLTLKGKTSLRYEINYRYINGPLTENDNVIFEKEFVDFVLSGNEIKLGLSSSYDFNKDSTRLELKSMTLIKYYDGSDLAKLIPPRESYRKHNFDIVNISQNELYGAGFGNYFWSNLFLYKNDRWKEPQMMILLCGNMGTQQSLNFNDTARADVLGVPMFSGENPFEMIPGKYKVTSTFTESPLGDIIPGRNVDKRIYTYYQVSTEFEIK